MENLNLEVRRAPYAGAKRGLALAAVKEGEGGTIVVTGDRNVSDALARELREAGVGAASYHSGLLGPDKERVRAAFASGKTRVLCVPELASAALAKRDVRLMVHLELPATLDAYKQDLKLAGKDGEPADAVLLLADDDEAARRAEIEARYPSGELVRRLLAALRGLDGQQASLEVLADQLGGEPPAALEAALKHLRLGKFVDPKGAISGTFTVRMLPNKEEPFSQAANEAGRKGRQRELEGLDTVLRYARAKTCRLVSLRGGEACGRCDVCRGAAPELPVAVTGEKPLGSPSAPRPVPAHEGAFARRRVDCPYCGGKVIAEELKSHCEIKHGKLPPEG